MSTCRTLIFSSARRSRRFISRAGRWKIFTAIAENISTVIDKGSCLAFSIGPLYEALAAVLSGKRGLGIHTPFFTDALMDLVNSGAVSNRHKEFFRGKSLASYAMGSGKTLRWLDRNPLVEFQRLDVVRSHTYRQK